MNSLLLFILLTLSGQHLPSVDGYHEVIDEKESIYLGLVQGITEYLPVSSTGHLILFDNLFQKAEAKKGTNTCERFYDKDEVKNSYFTIIQSGSILAVLFLYPRRFKNMIYGVFGKDKNGAKLVENLMISFLPVAVVGLLVNRLVQKFFYNKISIAAALAIGAIIMLISEKNLLKNAKYQHGDIDHMDLKKSLIVGLWQCLSLFPGMSRSMTTIVGGYKCGLSRKSSAEYSFLLGFITLSAATIFKIATDFSILFANLRLRTIVIGMLIAFLSSLVSIKLFISYLSRHGMKVFAIYRLLLSCIILFTRV